mmetsp:Transcript_2880/g.9377  ORF Transcript_2880/g.9377 Transcript_2880/m.9377 type:complete len:508 (+) Transcript_2880:268-1791(+)
MHAEASAASQTASPPFRLVSHRSVEKRIVAARFVFFFHFIFRSFPSISTTPSSSSFVHPSRLLRQKPSPPRARRRRRRARPSPPPPRCNLQRDRLLPGEDVEIRAAEVPVRRRLLVPVVRPGRLGRRTLEVEVAPDRTGAEVDRSLHLGEDLVVRDGPRAVRVDEHGERIRDADGVRQLHDATLREPGRDDGLGRLPGDVRRGAVNLRGVLPGEGAAAVRAPAAVGVDDDLTAGEAGVAVGAADGEPARRVQVEDGVRVEQRRGDDLLDHLLHEILADLLVGDGLVVLRGDEHGVDALRTHGAAFVLVLDRDLRLAVGADPRAGAVLAHLREPVPDRVREHERHRHELALVLFVRLGLVGGVAEHDALVAGADLFELLRAHPVDALADLRGLVVELDEDAAVVAVEADSLGREPDVVAHLADDGFVVNLGLGRDLAEDHHHAGFRRRLASHLGVGVLREARVEDAIGDLVRELVGVTLVDGLGGEEEGGTVLGRHCRFVLRKRGVLV